MTSTLLVNGVAKPHFLAVYGGTAAAPFVFVGLCGITAFAYGMCLGAEIIKAKHDKSHFLNVFKCRLGPVN